MDKISQSINLSIKIHQSVTILNNKPTETIYCISEQKKNAKADTCNADILKKEQSLLFPSCIRPYLSFSCQQARTAHIFRLGAILNEH
jgi:hypothetical protein